MKRTTFILFCLVLLAGWTVGTFGQERPGSVSSNSVYSIALVAANSVGGPTNGVTAATAASIAAAVSSTNNTTGNAAGATNIYGAPTFNAANVTNLPIIAPAAASVTPVPDIYVLTSYGSNNISEGDFIKYINQIYTNGYGAFGWKGVQADAGWAARDGNGKLIVNPNTFTNDLKYICDYAHARGVKIGVYYSILTNSGWNPFGQVNMHTNMLADIQVLVTNGVDWIKIDSSTSDSVNTAQQPVQFWNAVAATGANIHRQQTVDNYGNTGGYFAGTPTLFAGLNSAYVALGLPDTYVPANFTNSYAHFQRSLAARQFVSPAFKLEGTGWLWTGLINQYPYPDHCFVDMALMTAERLLLTPTVGSYSLTNKALWDLFQASPVTVADIVITNGADVVCSKIVGNKASGVRLVCFINSAATNKTTTYNLRDLGFPNNTPVTYYSPWFGNSLEGWATNTISVTVTRTNTLLYKMVWGYQSQIPPAGVTYLSDLEWASTANIPRGPSYAPEYTYMLSKDSRNGEGASNPLIIGSTTYTKGFCAGAYWMGSTNPSWEINIGYVPSQSPQLVLNFGKQQAWTGGNAAVRLTIYTNGVTSTVSGFVTNNASQATNFVVPLAGVYKVGFLMETNGAGPSQAVLGGCYITNSIP